MNKNIKKHQINILKRSIRKKLSSNPFSIWEESLKHPASKLALYNLDNQDLKQPHTLSKIKEKIGHGGNDKQFKQILDVFCDKTGKQNHFRGRPITQYRISQNKIQEVKNWYWETLEGQFGLTEEDMAETASEVFDIEGFLKLSKDEKTFLFELCKRLYSLPDKKRTTEYKRIKNGEPPIYIKLPELPN